jgi:hypothetical protein
MSSKRLLIKTLVGSLYGSKPHAWLPKNVSGLDLLSPMAMSTWDPPTAWNGFKLKLHGGKVSERTVQLDGSQLYLLSAKTSLGYLILLRVWVSSGLKLQWTSLSLLKEPVLSTVNCSQKMKLDKIHLLERHNIHWNIWISRRRRKKQHRSHLTAWSIIMAWCRTTKPKKPSLRVQVSRSLRAFPSKRRVTKRTAK